jgi:hypothetical protein
MHEAHVPPPPPQLSSPKTLHAFSRALHPQTLHAFSHSANAGRASHFIFWKLKDTRLVPI